MQFSKISLISLLVATVSAAAAVEQPAARDVKIASPESAPIEKKSVLEVRKSSSKKKGGSGGVSGGDDDDDDDDDNAASSLHLNVILAASAGAVAIGAMML